MSKSGQPLDPDVVRMAADAQYHEAIRAEVVGTPEGKNLSPEALERVVSEKYSQSAAKGELPSQITAMPETGRVATTGPGGSLAKSGSNIAPPTSSEALRYSSDFRDSYITARKGGYTVPGAIYRARDATSNRTWEIPKGPGRIAGAVGKIGNAATLGALIYEALKKEHELLSNDQAPEILRNPPKAIGKAVSDAFKSLVPPGKAADKILPEGAQGSDPDRGYYPYPPTGADYAEQRDSGAEGEPRNPEEAAQGGDAGQGYYPYPPSETIGAETPTEPSGPTQPPATDNGGAFGGDNAPPQTIPPGTQYRDNTDAPSGYQGNPTPDNGGAFGGGGGEGGGSVPGQTWDGGFSGGPNTNPRTETPPLGAQPPDAGTTLGPASGIINTGDTTEGSGRAPPPEPSDRGSGDNLPPQGPVEVGPGVENPGGDFGWGGGGGGGHTGDIYEEEMN